MPFCSACGKKVNGAVCPACGFDESCHYEAYPTLQTLNAPQRSRTFSKTGPVSSDVRDPIEIALEFLRAQGWDQKTLAEIRTVLHAAKTPAMNDPRYRALMNDLVAVLRQYQKKRCYAAICGLLRNAVP